MKTVKVMKLHEDAIIPVKAHESDSGLDIHALEDVVIEPGNTKVVRTGLAFDLPEGYEMQIRPRSGITSKTKLRVQLGTIDNEYVGEVGVIVDNINVKNTENLHGTLLTLDEQGFSNTSGLNLTGTYLIRKGDRIAQAVIQRIPTINIVGVKSLSESDRGTSGFGSTGI